MSALRSINLAALAVVVLTGTACQRPIDSPAPQQVQSDTASTPLAVLQRDTTDATQAAFRRANAAAASADTVIVAPDSLVLRIGEPVAIFDRLRIEARSTTGATVTQFAPFFTVEDPELATLGPAELVGRRAGQTRLLIRALTLDGTPAGRGVAVVMLRVVP